MHCLVLQVRETAENALFPYAGWLALPSEVV